MSSWTIRFLAFSAIVVGWVVGSAGTLYALADLPPTVAETAIAPTLTNQEPTVVLDEVVIHPDPEPRSCTEDSI